MNLGKIRYSRVPDITHYQLVHSSEIQNNGPNIADWNNKNKYISMNFVTLEMQKYRTIPIWGWMIDTVCLR